MSYISSITGPDFQSGFLYSTTNLSTDNASVINMSVNGLLTMNEFSLITLNLSNLTVPTINVSDLNVSELNVLHIEAENISCVNLSATNEISCDNIIKSNLITCGDNISTPKLYVNDTFFYGSTGTIVSSLVTMSSQVLYNLGNLDYKIISVTGTEYLTCDSTLGNTNISNLSGNNLSVENVSITTYVTAQQASILNNLNVSNNLYVYGDGGAVGRVRAGGIDFKESTSNTKTAYIDVLNSYTKVYLNKTMDFIKDDGAGGTPMIMSLDWGRGNVNMDNLSCDNISTDLLNNISAGENITLSTEAVTNKLIITATGGLNSSNLSLDNLSISNDLTCEGNISVGLQYTQEIIFMSANMANQNSQFISANTQDTYNLLNQDYSIQGSPGIKYLFCDHTLGNTNISNLSVDNLSVNNIIFDNLSIDNLSVTDSFTCNDAQIDDLYNCDMTNTLKAGSNISYPFITNLSVGFDTGSLDTTILMNPNISMYGIELLPDLFLNPPTFVMNLGRAELTAANISNLSVQTEFTAPLAEITNLTITGGGTFNHNLINSITPGANMSIVSVNNKPRIGLNPNINISNLSTINTSVNNISVLESITVGTGGIGGGVYAKNGTGVFSTGGFYLNNAIDGNGGNLNFFWTGGNISAYGIGTLDGHDVRLANGYNTGGLVVDGTINNINMSNCSITNLSVNVVQSSLTNASVINTEFLNVSGSAGNFYDGLTVFGSTGLQNTSITNLSLDNLTCDLTSNLTAGSNITITSVGGKPVIASSGGGSLPTNASFDNVSISNKLTVVDSIGCQTLGADGNIQSSNSFTIRKDAFTALTQTINGNEFRISTTSSNQDIRICNATGAGGLFFDAGLNNISIDNLSVANLSLTNLTTDLTSNLTAGTNITITSVGGKPVISASGGGGGVTDPLNLSQLNVSNVSVDVDVTITRDLNVQRYLDSGRPRFMMLARTTALAQTGAGERTMVFDTNSTAQVAGEFGVANGGEIQVSTGGWYRLSWSIGFIRASGGDRYSFRSYNMTRTNAGSYSFVQLKDRIGSIGYCRSSSLNRECSSVGTVLRYIPANGWVRIVIGAMIQGSSNFASSFNGTNLRASSNFMVEFISSASET